MSSKKETHYTVLNLKQNCTSREIKNAFIEMSKKYHPDKTKNKSNHALFLKVNEAYNVLHKPASRRLYDQRLYNNDDNRIYRHYYDDIYTTRNDPSFFRNRAGPGGFGNEPYYGIKGLKKVSNSVIVLVCVAFAAVGLGIELLCMRKSFTFDRERLRHDTARNQIFLDQARNQAIINGNKQQIQDFKDGKLRAGSMKEVTEEYRRRLMEAEGKSEKSSD